MSYKQILFIALLLLSNEFSSAQQCNCSAEDYKNWNQGGMVNESGVIDYLESTNAIIKDKVKTNKENMVAVKSRLNNRHNGYYFDYNFYLNHKIAIPKEINIKLINNKGNSISIKSTRSIGEDYQYYNFIGYNNNTFKNFINSGLITKIEFIDTSNHNSILAYFFLSMNESIDLAKIFCCAIKLKEEIVGQID